MPKGYGDTFLDTPENERTGSGSGFGTAGSRLRTIRTPTRDERALARRYLERVAPDLLDVLGLA